MLGSKVSSRAGHPNVDERGKRKARNHNGRETRGRRKEGDEDGAERDGDVEKVEKKGNDSAVA